MGEGEDKIKSLQEVYDAIYEKGKKRPPPKTIEEEYTAQRNTQRTVLFWFIIGSTTILIILFNFVVLSQGYIRFFFEGYEDFEILTDEQMRIYGLAVFAQIMSLLFIITKSLWNKM